MLKKLNEAFSKDERKLQEKINKLIADNSSLVFKAGAGSGKTYALIESLKYLIKNENATLQWHNQKIVVITFTNVAANEIKERLGNSQLVLVSTIHERLWNILTDYKSYLVEIHLEKLKDELVKLQYEIEKEEKFNNLEKVKQVEFIDVMKREENQEIFYENYSEKAAEARVAYKTIEFSFDIVEAKLLKSIGNFRKLVNNLYRKEKYKQTIENVKKKAPGYTEVNYNTRINHDRLDYMEISHDTLLQYGKSIINKYPLLKKIIINKFPYVFIDEYQDTSEEVVEIMQLLHEYAKKVKHHFWVGYYGDERQHIYSDGVGDNLLNYHSGLEVVSKRYNRRSFNEVINVINKVREDKQVQKTIYTDAEGGSVKFYVDENKKVEDFINKYKEEWNVSHENPIDCLVLTNATVAKYIGIDDLYSVMKESNLYKEGLGYQRLNEETLSKQFDRLGDVQKTLYNLFSIVHIVGKKHKTVNNILLNEAMKMNLTLKGLKRTIASLKKIKGDSLKEILESIEAEYGGSGVGSKFNELVEHIFLLDKKEEFSVDLYKSYILRNLGKIGDLEENSDEKQDDRLEKAIKTLDDLFSIKKEEFIKWYEYLIDSNEQSVRFHTYHGTKGLEFNNVIIIMENKFGGRTYFNHYFKNRSNVEKLAARELKTYKEVQNLLYVATSRAIRNLRILYLDDITEFSESVRDVFGEPIQLSENS